ncbi:BQ2448_2162 [Microbotryum intermedium]|uniref:BQ2448_2162 protein n=1 Tax=Microbotryum intermedium TaxID=269621 RepID=A0A238F5F6_9BASI|nr:BQ2448_2162 [Microbotryum intermedium]
MSRINRYVLLCAVLLFSSTFYYVLLVPRLPRDLISYASRPLWDTDQRPRRHIHSRLHDLAEGAELKGCEQYGWEARPKAVEVWDATILSTELPMLLIRLHELDPIVTKHFIIEATHTFTGIPKPLILPSALKSNPDFAPFLDKIHYRSIKGRTLAEGESPFNQEIELRASMTTFIKEYLPPRTQGEKDIEIALGPVLLFSDVDELVSRPTAKLLQSCRFPFPIHLGLMDYLYSFEFESGGIMKGVSSWRAHATHWPDRGEGASEYYRHGKVSEKVLADSGWHCSWCFEKIQDFVTKAKGYSHADRLGNRPAALLRPERIQKTICDGLDMFAMLPEAYTWREMASKWTLMPSQSIEDDKLPRLLRNKSQKYRWLLPGGCIREK